jgi:hypothetical protein
VAAIVLVHGIAQEQGSADTLEAEWLPDLAGGLRVAGYEELADRLWYRRGTPEEVPTRMAFYGDCFLRPGQQGTEPEALTEEARVVAELIAQAWLERAAADAPDPRDRQEAARELQYLRATGQQQGPGAVMRTAIASLARVPWFAPLGMAVAERFMMRSLTQVTRYFTDELVRTYALGQVAKLIGPDTRVLIGHSLGSVVAYEAAHRLDQPLPLLVTLGSPLGLRSIIYERLRPQPPGFPSSVARWVNLAGRDDFIAAEPSLASLFGAGAPDGAFEAGWILDTGAKPHDAGHYLTKRQTGRPIGETFTSSMT